MRKRMILVLAGLAVFIAAIGFVKTRQVKAGMAKNASFQMPPEAVTTVKAKQEPWPASVTAIGTVEAVHGVTVSRGSARHGVDRIEFDSGKWVRAGDVLVRSIPGRSRRSSRPRRRSAASRT